MAEHQIGWQAAHFANPVGTESLHAASNRNTYNGAPANSVREPGMPLKFQAVVVLATVLATQQQADHALTPEILYWRNRDGTPNRATGLLYRPELLAALSAGQPRENISVRILQAVEQQTPIAVMWAIPPGAIEPVGPSHAVISDTTSGNKVLPVWEAEDARDLRVIDPRTPFHDVGIMAAFPRSAFQPGRVMIIYAQLPDNPATGGHRRAQVFGEFPETRLRVK